MTAALHSVRKYIPHYLLRNSTNTTTNIRIHIHIRRRCRKHLRHGHDNRGQDEWRGLPTAIHHKDLDGIGELGRAAVFQLDHVRVLDVWYQGRELFEWVSRNNGS